MALSEEEEFELLSLEREKATTMKAAPDLSTVAGRLEYIQSKQPKGKEPYPFAPGYPRDIEENPYKVGGAVTDVAAGAGLSPEVAAGAGTAANFLAQAIPALAGGQVAKGAAPALNWAGKALMQSAVKPTPTDLVTGKAGKAIQTMLEEGINPSMGGMEKLRGMATQSNANVENLIKSTGGTVDKGAAASRMQDLIKEVEGVHPTPQEPVASIEKVYEYFLKNKLIPDNIPVEKAQAIKQEIYRMVKYGELGQDAPKEAAYKALGRGLKEEIEKAVPGVKDLNKDAGRLWNALNVSERRAYQELNKNPFNLALLTHNKALFATYIADKSAPFKGLVARMLFSGQKKIPAYITGSGIAGLEASRPQE